MVLTPEQQKAVAAWAAAGDNLASIQKRLIAEFGISLTYMDVRFLVDDLKVKLKDAPEKADASIGPGAPAEAPQVGTKEGADPGEEEPFEDEPLPTGSAGVTVTVDKVTLLPGAMASGTVSFANGVNGKWIVDTQGRPGITEISRPGFRPSPAEAQAFMEELSRALQQRGF
jgi:hypothetical protein